MASGSPPPGLACALPILLGVLTFAVVRPRGLPEALVAVPAAGLVLLVGLVSPASAGRRVAELAPTLVFLAAVLVLARLADDAGVLPVSNLLAFGATRLPFPVFAALMAGPRLVPLAIEYFVFRDFAGDRA